MAAHLVDNEVTERLDSYTGSVAYGTVEELDEIVRGQVYPEFWGTEIGKQFASTYAWTDAVENRIAGLLARKFGETGTPKSGVEYPGAILVWRLEAVVGDLMRIHDPLLTLANPPEPAQPEPPQLARARYLKNLRAELDADLGNGGFGGIGANEIRQKRKMNSDYDRLYRESVSDSGEANLPQITAELTDFADAYNSASAFELRQVGGIYRLKGIPYGADKFNKLLADAASRGLVRENVIDLREN
jgi:hypothetical protein